MGQSLTAASTGATWEDSMIDFRITDLFDDGLCLVWLEQHLHSDGFVRLQRGGDNRRRFHLQGSHSQEVPLA